MYVLKNSTKNRMTNFNIFVAVKRRKDDDAVVITTA